MRRKEREVASPAKIDRIIESCDCCRLGLAADGAPYIVPMNFGYRRENGVPTFYFHSAAAGRKLALIRRSPRAGFELDTGRRIQEGETACRYSFCYQSVVGAGVLSFVTEEREKREALDCILRHYTGKGGWAFEGKAFEAVTVLRLTADTLSCKEHL